MTFEAKMRFDAPADPDGVIRFTVMVALLAEVLVTVNLSMMHLQEMAVYCDVCDDSACLGGMMFLTVTAIVRRCCWSR